MAEYIWKCIKGKFWSSLYGCDVERKVGYVILFTLYLASEKGKVAYLHIAKLHIFAMLVPPHDFVDKSSNYYYNIFYNIIIYFIILIIILKDDANQLNKALLLIILSHSLRLLFSL